MEVAVRYRRNCQKIVTKSNETFATRLSAAFVGKSPHCRYPAERLTVAKVNLQVCYPGVGNQQRHSTNLAIQKRHCTNPALALTCLRFSDIAGVELREISKSPGILPKRVRKKDHVIYHVTIRMRSRGSVKILSAYSR